MSGGALCAQPILFFFAFTMYLLHCEDIVDDRNLLTYNFVLIIAGISKSQDGGFFVLWLLRIKVKINFIMIKEVIKVKMCNSMIYMWK